MFIDDTDYCVAGAREVGMHAVRYLDNAQVIHEIEVLLASSLACPGLIRESTIHIHPVTVRRTIEFL